VANRGDGTDDANPAMSAVREPSEDDCCAKPAAPCALITSPNQMSWLCFIHSIQALLLVCIQSTSVD